MSILRTNAALAELAQRWLPELCPLEGLAPREASKAIEAGTMVLLGNPAHPDLRPCFIGQPSRVKVNANIGTSPLASDAEAEAEKLRAAYDAGADAVMDLSTAGDLDAIRLGMLRATPLPLGTVPIYAAVQPLLDSGGDAADLSPDDLLAEIEKEAKQGVDFMTVHCGVTREGAAAAEDRLCGVVSRGGSILARWMRAHGRENPLFERYDEILEVAREHNVTLSLGDGLRPGAGHDAGDAAQTLEVIALGRLQARALEYGVQCMIEGPGHVPLQEVEAQVRTIKRLTNNAPLYVLGPLCTDSAPGYDHIAGAIGGATGVRAGVDFLCYLTPAEHLTLPDASDVRQGVMASRVAAQVGEVALGRPAAVERDRAISAARKALDWDGMASLALDPEMVRKRREAHAQEKECAMCGKFCAFKMQQP